VDSAAGQDYGSFISIGPERRGKGGKRGDRPRLCVKGGERKRTTNNTILI